MSPMHELFVAVRCEELPARFVEMAVAGLEKGLLDLLRGVERGAVRRWATPRRIAVAVEVAEGRPAEEKLVTGPPEAAAFRDGQPTRAALGFARGRGVDVADLEIVETPKGRVVAARVRTGGERTVELVAAGLERAVLGIPFPKTMRWGDHRIAWARPIHGLVALYDGAVIPARIAHVEAGARTLGHRLSPGPFEVRDAASWVEGLRAHHVEPDREARRARILADLRREAAALGASVEAHLDLVDEVVDLVEWPVVVRATFDEALLELPPRLLVEAMKLHQRTFPLEADGRLLSSFLVVTNHPAAGEPEVAATIARGNARVVAARFDDARFFYAEDRKLPLAEHARGLADMRWIRKGGTMADKAERIAALARALAPLLGADPDHAETAGRLAKADLCTQMVGEFPELQGHVGRLLAEREGLPGAVALAIEEHYLPRFSGDALPTTPEGRAVALADRVDTLAGCFAQGLKPKGSADPLGLRRAAHGLALLVVDAGLRLDLAELLGMGAFEVGPDLVDFCLTRFRAQQLERHPTDVVDAVLATGDRDLTALASRVEAMAELARSPEYAAIKTTFKRVMGLTKDHADPGFDPAALAEPAERALAAELERVAGEARALAEALDHRGALARLATLRPAVDRLFDEVFVMADDPEVRRNRLGLLRAVADAFRAIADFTVLST